MKEVLSVSQASAGTVARMPVAAGRKGFKAELDPALTGAMAHALAPDERTARLYGRGAWLHHQRFDGELAARAGHRSGERPGVTGQLPCGWPLEDAAARFSVHRAAVPVFRLVIGVDDDPRAWVRVANALLDCIASGAVRAGSRVPPVSGLGLELPVPPGTSARAFGALAREGVLRWVPGRGYFVRTRFSVPVSDRPRQDGRVTAVLPGAGRQPAGRDKAVGLGARER